MDAVGGETVLSTATMGPNRPSGRTAMLLVPSLQGDFRNWSENRQWARGIADQLTAQRRPA